MHSKTKHIPIKYHFLREQVLSKVIKLEYVGTKDQIADISLSPFPNLSLKCFELSWGFVLSEYFFSFTLQVLISWWQMVPDFGYFCVLLLFEHIQYILVSFLQLLVVSQFQGETYSQGEFSFYLCHGCKEGEKAFKVCHHVKGGVC